MVPLNFLLRWRRQRSCLPSSQAIAASVTNPFMVTTVFTIFFGLELLFIRILAIAGG
jgi:hypothetical protein